MTVHFTWFRDRFRVLPADASEETVRIYARAYIMMLLSTQLFGDKSANRVHIRWLPFVANLDDMGRYSWGSAALAWLYRCMCRVANKNVTNLAGLLQLLQSWIFWRFPSLRPEGFEAFSFPLASRWSAYLPPNDGKEQRVIRYRLALDRLTARDIVWEPYSALDVLAVVHPEILIEEHSRLWRAVTSLIYFAVIEWHQVDRVVPQLGGVQHIPEDALNVDWLHAKDGRGGDRWFSYYYQVWHLHWGNRVDAVISIDRVAHPGPSADYLDWWFREAQRFLSPGAAFTDPRGTQIPPEAFQRGSSQVPRRLQLPDMPDNRCVERRRRVGTRDTGREWRWLHDAMQEDDAGGEARDEVDHRVHRSSARRGRTVDPTQFGGGVSGTAATQAGGGTFTSRSYSPMPEPALTYFADLIRDDAGTSNVQFGGQSYQPQMPEVHLDTAAYQPHMTDMHSQPADYQGEYVVDLNVPAGLSKHAKEEHARDLPIMNGIREIIKSVEVLDSGSPNYRETLHTLSSRLRSLQGQCNQHFQSEDVELLPMMEAVELSDEQDRIALEHCFDVMQGTHRPLLKFFLEGLAPHDAMKYLDLISMCRDKEKMERMLQVILE
ncbi:hypothetical protein Ahy_B02g059300 [Arachis hypogaea]|uniref:Aminotransferase-like plant mobile domain-containing protein n=1 Tax=Arachis hypogaea TaxID=3818 RepID=A0A445AGJ5_ARAHY|nr:hypothetical protein Ahy_B02g059300 [Arachis hypogaea]